MTFQMGYATGRTPQRGDRGYNAIADVQASYDAAKTSRHRRRRTGIHPTGSGADYHYRVEAEYLRIMEQARDYDRNDDVVGQMVTRAVNNIIQDGFRLDPETGDKKVDADLKSRFQEWANDPDQCDLQQEMTFAEIEQTVLRSVMVDGDHICLPVRDGALQLIEGHRLRSPRKGDDSIVHGVRLDANRRRIEYIFTNDDIGLKAPPPSLADTTAIPVRDEDGKRQIIHPYFPKRVSQTRGVSVFAPIFDTVGMFSDINFARLVQQQVVSCFAIFRQREESNVGAGAYGERRTLSDGRTEQNISPGMQIEGLKGEKLEGFSPSVPNPSFFEHVRLILTLIGVNLGMPLVMVLMDASETNFSGWRGAFEQAKMGFRRTQRLYARRFHRNVYCWLVRRWILDDPTLAHAAERLDIFKHKWGFPSWPYIEPTKDATADIIRVRNALISPRRLHAERDQDWAEIADEIVADNALMIRAAKKTAAAINGEFDDDDRVGWRDLVSLPTPDRVSLSLSDAGGEPTAKTEPADDDAEKTERPKNAGTTTRAT